MGAKKFFITIDTEGDNQWDNRQMPTTENARYLPRFQGLCEKYGFFPVWLTDYEMAGDPFFVDTMAEKQEKGCCEIGAHVHAWNNPPDAALPSDNGQRAYLYEYGEEIMEAKLQNLTELITSRFGRRPISHRSGRWAMDETYFRLLTEQGYKVDCSVTPFINWGNCKGATGKGGSDYSNHPVTPYFVNEKLLEMPMSIRRLRCFRMGRIHSFHNLLGEIRRYVSGEPCWLRPDASLSEKSIQKIIRQIDGEPGAEMMFMIHSSELMPAGSPSFPTKESVEKLYALIERCFQMLSSLGYEGSTLRDYYETVKKGDN